MTKRPVQAQNTRAGSVGDKSGRTQGWPTALTPGEDAKGDGDEGAINGWL
ncbi:MAG TPA: hypothetical protein VEQ40_14435 [Pyrinomonadaceae bacterium]|nr:hypothetical protein [Pyrinomonadaceae bacterium]